MSSKRCAMECGRPVTSDSPESQLCAPCLEEAEWENSHSDNAHEDVTNLPVGEIPAHWTFKARTSKASKLAQVASVRTETETCWICHPEFNKAKASYTARVGTSRQGIVLTVPPKADAKTKALTVAERIEGQHFEKGSVKVRTAKGVTTLRAGELTLTWDAKGRFLAEGSSVNGKKVRNVSEALRVLSA